MVTAEELNMDTENPIYMARGPRGYLRDTEEVTDVIRDDVDLICRYVFYWKKRLAKVYVYTWMEEGTPLKYIHFWYLGCPDLPAESRAEEYMIYPVFSTKLRTYYYDKDGNVTGMKDDLHLAGFRLCPVRYCTSATDIPGGAGAGRTRKAVSSPTSPPPSLSGGAIPFWTGKETDGCSS